MPIELHGCVRGVRAREDTTSPSDCEKEHRIHDLEVSVDLTWELQRANSGFAVLCNQSHGLRLWLRLPDLHHWKRGYRHSRPSSSPASRTQQWVSSPCFALPWLRLNDWCPRRLCRSSDVDRSLAHWKPMRRGQQIHPWRPVDVLTFWTVRIISAIWSRWRRRSPVRTAVQNCPGDVVLYFKGFLNRPEQLEWHESYWLSNHLS